MATANIEGKYILAAYDVPKSGKKELAYRRILQGVLVEVDKDGNWRVSGCDTYKVARITRGYVGGNNHEASFVIPPETVEEFKADDMLAFEPIDQQKCKVTRITKFGKKAKSSVSEWEFNLVEGQYPNIDKLMSVPPRACYRYAMYVNADFLATLTGIARKCFGPKACLELATAENEDLRPIVGFAEGKDVRLELLLMQIKQSDQNSRLAKPRPKGDLAETVKELETKLKASEQMVEHYRSKAELLAKATKKEEKPQEKPQVDEKKEDDMAKEKFGWVVYGTTKDGKVGWVSFSRLKTNQGAENWLKRTADDELASVKAEYVDSLEEWGAKAEEVKATLKGLCDRVVTYTPNKSGKSGIRSTWEREPETPKAEAPKEEAPKLEKPPVEKPKADKPKAPKPPKAEQPAEVSLESMTAWAKERGLVASQKNPTACIWVEGESKPYAEELKQLGFRFAKKRKSWYKSVA